MGMFDDIQCDYPLPDGLQLDNFQTKSLGCNLDQYKIDSAGQLWINNTQEGSTLPLSWIEYNRTTEIVFYTSTGSMKDNTYEWHQYISLFKQGKLILIERQ